MTVGEIIDRFPEVQCWLSLGERVTLEVQGKVVGALVPVEDLDLLDEHDRCLLEVSDAPVEPRPIVRASAIRERPGAVTAES